MSVTLVRQEPDWLIRMDGELNLSAAVELKTLLVNWLASGRNLELDLRQLEELDLPVLEVLYAAGRGAEDRGVRIVSRLSKAAAGVARDAGFDPMPGLGIECDG